MANAMPWSVRGIDPDIREQAVEAAHRSGLSVGQWLNQVLAGSLDEDEPEEIPPRARRSARRSPERMLAERLAPRRAATAAHRFAREEDDNPVLDLLQDAVEAIERIERRQVTPAVRRGAARHDMRHEAREEPREDSAPAITEHLRTVESRLSELLRQRSGTMEASPREPASRQLEARLAGIMATLERMQHQMVAPELPAVRPAERSRLAEADPAFEQTLAEIEARRRVLDSAPAARAAVAPAQPTAPEPAFEAMRADLARLASRIDDLRHTQTSGETIAAVRRELAQVSAGLEQISPQRLVGLVENAVSGLADRLVRAPHAGLPPALSEPLERVHEDVRAVLREVSSARGTELLSREVGNIARRLDQISNAPSVEQIERIGAETAAIKRLVEQATRSQPLEGLAHQIEQLARQVERSQVNPTARDDRALLDAIRDVSDRLERLDPGASFVGLESRLDAIASLEHRLSAMAGIEARLGELAMGMEKLAKKTQPLPKLDSITERLERIDRALDNPKAHPLAGLDQLTDRLDKIGSALDKVSSPPARGQDEALMSLMERLSSRMEQVAAHNGDTSALDQLQRDIASLARRVETTGSAPAGLDNLERAVSDLFAHLDQTRRDMQGLAESAATRAAENTLKAGGGARDPGGEALAAEGLLLLKRDLNDFKSTQSEAEHRTRETLEQMQATLGLMLKRLSEAEERVVRAAAAPPAPAARAEAPAMAAPPLRAENKRPAAPVMGEAPFAAPAAGGGFDLPLEPGLEPGLAPAPAGDPAAPADARANFIAAARRAAQAAAEKSQAALAEAPDSTEPAPKAARRAAGGNRDSAAVNFVVKARRPLLLGLAALVFSLGALKVMGNRTGAPDPTPPALQPGAAPTERLPVLPGKAADPETTGSLGRTTPAPAIQEQPVPGLNAPSIGDPHFNSRLNKRGQRLGDTPALSQADPLTTGSLGQDGAGKPIETGGPALGELATQSPLKGLEALKEAALKGNTAALFEIGSRFADGRGVTRDPKLAMRWLEQGAAAGHAPSQYRLGSLYREGRAGSKDSNLAFQWFDRAAAQGHVLAMHNAAVLLAEGVHGSPDYAGAALWFRRAAEFGIKDSQFNVAILYARGLGVPQDFAESYRWFAIAANQGDVDAGKKRDEIGARLTKEHLAAEAEKVKTFKPKKPEAQANDPGSWETQSKRA